MQIIGGGGHGPPCPPPPYSYGPVITCAGQKCLSRQIKQGIVSHDLLLMAYFQKCRTTKRTKKSDFYLNSNIKMH